MADNNIIADLLKEAMDAKTKLKKPDAKKGIQVHVAEVRRHDGPILLPEEMSVASAVQVLQRKLEYDQEKVVVREAIDVFPWDGAIALAKAISEMFGVVMQAMTPGFFGPNPPEMISIEIGPEETVKVPWGRFSLPGMKGWVATGTHDKDGRVVFEVVSECTHGDEDRIRQLIALTKKFAATSIYKGRAISVKFYDEDEDKIPIPTPKFLKLADTPTIFTRELERAIETNVLTVIRHTDAVRKAKIPVKRGVLLAGPYGTGKTLTANVVANEAVKHGWTFIYVHDVDELPEALTFARSYQPAVVFAEDIDRAAGVTRDDDVNDLLNTLDGISGKNSEIMTILTSNFADSINPAMRRPGRIDVVLEINPPDAEAARRLIAMYAGSLIMPTEYEKLTVAGEILGGQIPAVIREAVERAKLEAIRRSGGESEFLLAADVEAAAGVLLAEQKLFAPKAPEAPDAMEMLADAVAKHVLPKLDGIHSDVGDILGKF